MNLVRILRYSPENTLHMALNIFMKFFICISDYLTDFYNFKISISHKLFGFIDSVFYIIHKISTSCKIQDYISYSPFFDRAVCRFFNSSYLYIAAAFETGGIKEVVALFTYAEPFLIFTVCCLLG